MTDGQPQPRLKYPNAFLAGFISGCTLQAGIRFGTLEPLSARPFSYLKIGLFMGIGMSYYDWYRRVILDEVLQK